MVLLVHAVVSREILKDVENSEHYNVTTLYPVINLTYIKEKDNIVSEQKVKENDNATEEKRSYKFDSKENNYSQNAKLSLFKKDRNTDMKSNFKNKTKEIEIDIEPKNNIVNITSWNINTTYSNSKLDGNEIDKNGHNQFKNQNDAKVFKPSPQLGKYYDENAFVLPPLSTEEMFFPQDKPLSGSGFIR